MPFFGRKDDDPDLAAARAEAESVLPVGWKLAEEDREGFLLLGETQIALDVWAAAAEGPGGALELAVACDKAGAFRALASRLRGELETSEAWCPPLDRVERH